MPDPRPSPTPGSEALVEAIMEAQADIQTPLGLLRLNGEIGSSQGDRLTRALARLHAVLAYLGKPMYDPATHPDVEALASSPLPAGGLSEALSRVWKAASDLHGMRLAKESEDEYGDSVDLYDAILRFEAEFPFAELARLASAPNREASDG